MPVNVVVTVAIVALSLPVVTPTEIGFASWRCGFRWGGAVFALTLLGFLAAAYLPGPSELFEDRRVEGGVVRMLYETVVRIPLGTVLVEEVAFRGVLPALLRRRASVLGAYAAASVLFGLWHVVPAWAIGDVNPVIDRLLGDGWAGRAAGVSLAVSATFVAGLGLCFLRQRSASLLAPALAHVGTNSLGFAIAWFSMR